MTNAMARVDGARTNSALVRLPAAWHPPAGTMTKAAPPVAEKPYPSRRRLAPLVAMTSAYQSKDFFL